MRCGRLLGLRMPYIEVLHDDLALRSHEKDAIVESRIS